MNAVAFEGFRLAFRGSEGDHVILDDVTMTLKSGGFYLMVGESGSGKSSLLGLITGLWEEREPAPKIRGSLEVLGKSVVKRGYPRELRGRVQAVLQEDGLLDELSPRQNVELGLRVAGRSKKLSLALLSQAGMEHPPTSVSQLSGGQRKRVAVARALAGDPELLIFDEPTAGLDVDSARQMAELLSTTHDKESDRTTIVISHDLQAFRGLANQVLLLDPEKKTIIQMDAAELGDAVPRSAVAKKGRSGPPPIYGVQRILLELAGFVHTFTTAITRLPPVYPGIVTKTATRFILESVLFVVVGCATIGGLATFFSLRNNPLEGAFSGAVITGCGKVLVAVLVPLMASFFFTARIAAGAAARLGTMKRTSQVSALRLMGIRPADYLLTPLVWGIGVALPIATAAGIIGACLASMVAAKLVTGISTFGWAKMFFAQVELEDARYGILKTLLSGFLVAVQTYYLAMGPKRSGQDVGHAVNRSIVVGIFSVLVVHAVLTLLQFL